MANIYKGMDTECYFGRHEFKNGFCVRTGCKVDQNNLVHIVGRRWFERTNGNTYHSATITMPDGTELRVPYAYGYGSQYEDSALELLQKHFGDVKEDGAKLHPYLTSKGFYPSITVHDVTRKKDL